jgi:hypothetical protein
MLSGEQRAAAATARTMASPASASSSSEKRGRRGQWTSVRRTGGTWMKQVSRGAPARAASAARQHS